MFLFILKAETGTGNPQLPSAGLGAEEKPETLWYVSESDSSKDTWQPHPKSLPSWALEFFPAAT